MVGFLNAHGYIDDIGQKGRVVDLFYAAPDHWFDYPENQLPPENTWLEQMQFEAREASPEYSDSFEENEPDLDEVYWFDLDEEGEATDTWVQRRYANVIADIGDDPYGYIDEVVETSSIAGEIVHYLSKPHATSGSRYGRRLTWDEWEWINHFRRIFRSQKYGTGIERGPKWQKEAGGGHRGYQTPKNTPWWELLDKAA